jgi:hypothetical protein
MYVEVGVTCDLISGIGGEVKFGEGGWELERLVLEIAVPRWSTRPVSTILVSESKSQEGCSVDKEERGLRGSGELEPEGDNDRFSRREATLLPVSAAETVEPDICRIE